jgi:two-component system, OmpR family, phosphate regulon sensor histidine kinase PhoR
VWLCLLEPGDSAYAARIEAASNEAGLSVARIESIESAPTSAALIGVGPSIPDPLRCARQLRAAESQALLVFFAASSAARNALQAELVRDPFVYPRFEIVELPNNVHQLATRMSKVVSKVQRRLHMRRTTRRGRTRGRSAPTNGGMHVGPLLSHVLANTRDGVLSTDESGRLVTWNAAAARLLGLGEDDPVAPVRLTRPEHRELAELIRDVLATGVSREAHITCDGEDSQPIQAQASAAPMRDARGAVQGVTLVLRDDADYQRIQAALREANRQKDEFLAIMSHELRTPLTSILGYTDMLLRGLSGPLAPIANKYVSNVRSAGDRLLELVNSLLDYTRLEAGVERLELRTIDLARVVGQVVHMFRSVAQSKGVALRLDIAKAMDTEVQADEDRVAHVFRSMLGNALKFTPEGGHVNVRIEPSSDPTPGVRVSIRDSGIGMRAEQIGRVWERFYQGDASLTRPYGGMGLGLSIARHLVALHGGSVGAESSGPGRGSTFWFSLPRRQSH